MSETLAKLKRASEIRERLLAPGYLSQLERDELTAEMVQLDTEVGEAEDAAAEARRDTELKATLAAGAEADRQWKAKYGGSAE